MHAGRPSCNERQVRNVPTRPLRYADPLTEDRAAALRLRRQWVVRADGNGIDVNWCQIPLRSGTTLLHHPDSRVTRVEGEGWGAVILGAAVTTDLRSTLAAQLQRLLIDDEDVTVETLHKLAGTYVVIRHSDTTVRIYTDPAGMMPVFFRESDAASTPTLLSPLYRDQDLEARFRFGRDNDWYPWTLTPFVGVHALPANHVLTLPGGRMERFWPTEQPPGLEAVEGVTQIAQLLRSITTAATELGPLLCSLTGGRDSRVNLAALGERASSVEFFTVRGDGVAACDVKIPTQLAGDFGLDHRFVDNRAAREWLVALYDEMTAGMAVGGRRDVIGAAASIASSRYLHLNGNLGALAKSFFWHTRNPRVVRSSALAKEFTDRPPEIMTAINEWLASVPELDPPTTYNLMYLEQRGGRWMGVGEAASNLFYDSITPFCSREVFESLCGLPVSTQYGGDLLTQLVYTLWPELLSIEYCRARRNWSGYVPRSLKNRIKATLHEKARA